MIFLFFYYMSYQKVPARLESFCRELNERREKIDPQNIISVYTLSFWAHFELVTIHPWADGNGRTSRLLMNLLQWEFNLVPSKILKEDKSEYIQALIDARENDDENIFIDYMIDLHTRHLTAEIANYKALSDIEMVGKWSIKPSLAEKMADILDFMSNGNPITTDTVVGHFGFAPTTAKRYLRQLAQFGYVKSFGGNKNRMYKKIE